MQEVFVLNPANEWALLVRGSSWKAPVQEQRKSSCSSYHCLLALCRWAVCKAGLWDATDSNSRNECPVSLAKVTKVSWQHLLAGYAFLTSGRLNLEGASSLVFSLGTAWNFISRLKGKKKKGGKEGKKQLLRGYGFWLDSSVVNPALSFRDWLIYGGKLCFSSPSTKRATSECVACRRTPAVTLSWKWCRCLEGRCFLPALGYLTRWILQMGSCLILRSD